MAEKILIVDDEREITDLVALYLENERFTVFKCYTAQEAMDCIDKEKLDLAILDVMLPDMNGFEICKRIRRDYTYPVIMLTAKIAEVDRITGLTLGADDYVVKPFLPLELVARVKAQLRRYTQYNTGAKPDDDVIEHSGLLLNTKTRECTLCLLRNFSLLKTWKGRERNGKETGTGIQQFIAGTGQSAARNRCL